MTKKDQIRALLKSIETGDPGPVTVVDEAKYIQHNPQTHEGSEGLADLFQRLSKTSPRVNIVRAFGDGEFVFAHTEYDFSSRKIGFEVFRFEDGRAVEHWDNIQDRQGPNQSGRTMVDGSTIAASTVFSPKAALYFASVRVATAASIVRSMIYFEWQMEKWWNIGTRPKRSRHAAIGRTIMESSSA
jgi:predicted SnoaL-like aldol condensation-catalyzing enzyme